MVTHKAKKERLTISAAFLEELGALHVPPAAEGAKTTAEMAEATGKSIPHIRRLISQGIAAGEVEMVWAQRSDIAGARRVPAYRRITPQKERKKS